MNTVFSPEQLQKLVDETMPLDVKKNEKFVVGAVDQHGAQVVVSLKFRTNWEVLAAVKHDWTGDNSASAKVLLRWT